MRILLDDHGRSNRALEDERIPRVLVTCRRAAAIAMPLLRSPVICTRSRLRASSKWVRAGEAHADPSYRPPFMSWFSSTRSATPKAKKLGAHSPTKIPQRSARAVDSDALSDAAQLITLRAIEASPAANMWSDVTPFFRRMVNTVPSNEIKETASPLAFPGTTNPKLDRRPRSRVEHGHGQVASACCGVG
ncbi:hypothetical protein [Saccharopolyspora aridisoli]|uniref:hypothetical protein n=1 Tax=Saccharopolyspora aridisoli TaxID=2530385 RepID=UPI001A9DB449|nr:hypothetical protein [Saccharopolyspora aridisoli]